MKETLKIKSNSGTRLAILRGGGAKMTAMYMTGILFWYFKQYMTGILF